MIQYLIVVNIVSFILYTINHLLYKYTESKNIDKLITIFSFAFGSFGILIGYFIFDRDFEKRVLMSRIFLFSITISQLIILIFIFDLKTYFQILKLLRNKYFIYYLFLINIITFILFGFDKYNALHQKKRVSNLSLLFFSFIGGSIGAVIAMKNFRHKTKKDYYVIGLKYIIVMQVLFLILVINV